MTEADYEDLLKQYKISGPGMGDDESIGKNDETQGTMSPGGEPNYSSCSIVKSWL
jgi:hypothetical protein